MFCSYANSNRQRVLIDWELYLSESWFAAMDFPSAHLAVKSELAWRMSVSQRFA